MRHCPQITMPRPHSGLGRILTAVMLTGSALAVTVASDVPLAHAASYLDILPGDDISPTPPDCGSINITGEDNDAGWRFRSSIGSGSTVFVGQKIVVKASMVQTILPGANGNDGPDPLTLKLQPSGAVKAGAAPIGSAYDGQTAVNFAGDGAHGPVAAVGDWGYKFDANSSPTFLGGSSDGTNEMLTVTLEATAPGEIQIKSFNVSGYDGTPKGANFSCFVLLDWYWNVIAIKAPIAGIDFATVDASYSAGTPSDASGGRHGVVIDVLANDSDPNEILGFDLDHDVRIASWDPALDCGTPEQNGKTPTVANFNSLALGPCVYYPYLDVDTSDSPTYVLVQRSGLKTTTGFTNIEYVANEPPVAADAEIELTAGVTYPAGSIVLGSTIDEPENEPYACSTSAGLTNDHPEIGTVAMAANCTFAWTPQPGNLEGDVTIGYRVCDTHQTQTNVDLAPGVRAANYDVAFPGQIDDLAEFQTRRCSNGTAVLDITGPGPQFAIPFRARNDFDVVDHSYPNLGPYHLLIDVLDNDDIFGGVPVVSLPLNNGGVPFSSATIAVDGNMIAFTPGSQAPKVVSFTYQVCAGTMCTTAKVSVTVIRNNAPFAQPDDLGDPGRTAQIFPVADNDVDAEGEAKICNTTLADVSPPTAFTSVSINAACTLSFDAVDNYVGAATVEYRICDDHTLAFPTWPATPYGILAFPGGPASRCMNATVYMSFADPVDVLNDPPLPPSNLPVCVDDAGVTTKNIPVVVDVTANDTDLDDFNVADAVTLIDPDESATAQGGSIVAANGKITYTPKAGFTGVDTATYNVLDPDGNGCSALLTVTVSVNPDDIDGDGIPNADDPDANGDGIPDHMPGLPPTGSSPSIAVLAALFLAAGTALLATRSAAGRRTLRSNRTN